MGRSTELCPVEATARIVGGRWKAAVLEQLFQGAKRFSELKRAISGITQRTLSQQLRELQRTGIIERTVYPDTPPPRCVHRYSSRKISTAVAGSYVPMGQIALGHYGVEKATGFRPASVGHTAREELQ